MIVFSHLRWDFVFQRPQHLMTRLARTSQVYFFEEPVARRWPALAGDIPTSAQPLRVPPSHVRSRRGGLLRRAAPRLAKIARRPDCLAEIEHPVAWFYTPMALPLLQSLDASAVVYDCMDELSAFRNAPAELLEREQALLKSADVVFTGGPSLFRAKQALHSNVHCFPSSVEQEHFGKAQGPGARPRRATRPSASAAGILWRYR